jgi:hypothetical protein
VPDLKYFSVYADENKLFNSPGDINKIKNEEGDVKFAGTRFKTNLKPYSANAWIFKLK